MRLDVITDFELNNIDGIKDRLANRMPIILEGIGAYMEASTVKNFEEQGRPEHWAPLSEETLKQKKGNLILYESGLMEKGITFKVDESERVVYIGGSGPAKKRYRIHQKGGEAGPVDNRVDIPARTYLVILDENQKWMNEFIREQVFNE